VPPAAVGQGHREQLDGQRRQGGHTDEPLERVEMSFRLETLERPMDR
jgi:hypothetical protein